MSFIKLSPKLLPTVLDEFIEDPHSAFIPGRIITDNVLLGFEAMHWIRQHRGGKTGYAALKLDMS